MVTDILNEIVTEVAEDPMRLVAEVVQFVALVAIVWVIAIGTRSRKGFVANMIAEAEHATKSRLAEAGESQSRLAAAQSAAGKSVRASRNQARRVVEDAKREAAAFEAQERSAADEEAQRIVQRAESALASELEQMHAESRDELIDVVSEATRAIMNERLTLGEQRRLIENAVSASVSGIEEQVGGA